MANPEQTYQDHIDFTIPCDRRTANAAIDLLSHVSGGEFSPYARDVMAGKIPNSNKSEKFISFYVRNHPDTLSGKEPHELGSDFLAEPSGDGIRVWSRENVIYDGKLLNNVNTEHAAHFARSVMVGFDLPIEIINIEVMHTDRKTRNKTLNPSMVRVTKNWIRDDFAFRNPDVATGRPSMRDVFERGINLAKSEGRVSGGGSRPNRRKSDNPAEL